MLTWRWASPLRAVVWGKHPLLGAISPPASTYGISSRCRSVVEGSGPSTPHGHVPSPSLHPDLQLLSPKVHCHQEHGGFCNKLMTSSCLTQCISARPWHWGCLHPAETQMHWVDISQWAGLTRRDVHTRLPWSSSGSVVEFGIMLSMGDKGQEGGCSCPQRECPCVSVHQHLQGEDYSHR